MPIFFLHNQQFAGVDQIQSDWDQSNNSAVDYIKNKPTLEYIQGLTRTSSLGVVTLHDFSLGTFEFPDYCAPELSGACIFNNSAEQDVYVQLPPAEPNLEFSYQVKNNGHGLFLIVNSTDVFNGDIAGTGYDKISSTAPGASLYIRCVEAGVWATTVMGRWSAWVDAAETQFAGSYRYADPASLGLNSMALKSFDDFTGDMGLSNDSDHVFYVKPSADGNGGYNFDLVAGDGTGTNQAGGKLRLKSGRSTGIRFSSVEVWANPGDSAPGNTPVDDVLVAQFLAGLTQVYYSVGSNLNPNPIKGAAYFAGGEPLKGGMLISPTPNTGNFNTVITNHPLGQTTNFRHPDPGVALVDYVLSEGDQTVNGAKTFSNISGSALNGCYSPIEDLPQNTSIIDVSGKSIIRTGSNTEPTEITNLTNGVAGQTILIIGGSDIDASTINNGGNFVLKNSTWTAYNGATVQLIFSGTVWIEI